MPYHVLLRAILDAETISDALAALQRAPRSSSAGYLLAHDDGIAAYVEAAPGDFSQLYLLHPDAGLLLHTNHFVSERFRGKDVSLWAIPDSPFRLARLRSLLEAEDGPFTVDTFQAALADHAGYPSAICCHPDARHASHDQGATVVSAIMALDERRLWLSDGSRARRATGASTTASSSRSPHPWGRVAARKNTSVRCRGRARSATAIASTVRCRS